MVVRVRFVPRLIFSLGLFDHFTLPEQAPNSRVGRFLSACGFSHGLPKLTFSIDGARGYR
jgi:hypothetical protein